MFRLQYLLLLTIPVVGILLTSALAHQDSAITVLRSEPHALPPVYQYTQVEVTPVRRDSKLGNLEFEGEGYLFNGTARKLATVEMRGLEVVFDSTLSSEEAPLNDWHEQDALYALTIFADTVRIRGRLHLPGTTVSIYARELILEDTDEETGSIDTAARPYATPASLTQMDGLTGTAGGDINLVIAKLSAESGVTRFFTNGADGQDPVPGRSAESDESIVDCAPITRVQYVFTSNVTKILDDAKKKIPNKTLANLLDPNNIAGKGGMLKTPLTLTFAKADSFTKVGLKGKVRFRVSVENSKISFDTGWADGNAQEYPAKGVSLPSPGINAMAGGTPGDGGAGGILRTSVPLIEAMVDLDGGLPGAAIGPYEGIRPGNPIQWKHVKIAPEITIPITLGLETPKFDIKNPLNSKVIVPKKAMGRPSIANADKHTITASAKDADWESEKGLSVERVEGSDGTAGQMERLQDGPAIWLRVENLEPLVQRMRDAFLAGDFDTALRFSEQLVPLVEGVNIPAGRAGYPLYALRSEVYSMSQRLRSELDFFGHSRDWVPMLSLEVSYSAFEREIESAIRILVLAKALERFGDRDDARKQALEDALAQQEEWISNLRGTLERAQSVLPALEAEKERLDFERYGLLTKLKEKERELVIKFRADKERQRMARAIFAGFKSTLELAAFQSPKAAPLAGLMTGIDTYQSSQPGKVDESAISAALSGLLKSSDVEEARATLVALSAGEAWVPEDYVDEILGLSEIVNELTVQHVHHHISQHWNAEAGTAFADWEELRDVLERDSDFKEAFDPVVLLMTQRQLFTEKINEAISVINDTAVEIQNTVYAMDALQQAKSSNLLDVGARDAVARIAERAKVRLIRYQYSLARSYEYRMLEPCPVDYTRNALFDRLAKLFDLEASTDKDATESAPFSVDSDLIKELRAVYEADLRAIAARIWAGFDQRPPLIEEQRTLTLKGAELDPLNFDGALTLDLGAYGLVTSKDWNARIANIEILPDRSSVQFPDGIENARVSLTISPGRRSQIQWSDQKYAFTHSSMSGARLALWGYTWEPGSAGQAITLTDDYQSLLASLVDRDFGNQHFTQRIMFRPGALGSIHLHVDGADELGSLGEIETLVLRFTVHINKKG